MSSRSSTLASPVRGTLKRGRHARTSSAPLPGPAHRRPISTAQPPYTPHDPSTTFSAHAYPLPPAQGPASHASAARPARRITTSSRVQRPAGGVGGGAGSSTGPGTTGHPLGSGGVHGTHGHAHAHPHGHAAGAGAGPGAAGAAHAGKKPPSRHLVWYREIVPAMLPVVAIGTGVFFALQLAQTHLSHSRALEQASERITHLEQELAVLSARQKRQAATWGDGLGRVVRMIRSGSGTPAGPDAEAAEAALQTPGPTGAVSAKGERLVHGVPESTTLSAAPASPMDSNLATAHAADSVGQLFAPATGVAGGEVQGGEARPKKSSWWRGSS